MVRPLAAADQDELRRRGHHRQRLLLRHRPADDDDVQGRSLVARAEFEQLTPSSRYSGEREGERGERRSDAESADLERRLRCCRVSYSTRTQPLSPTLSPEYREEG